MFGLSFLEILVIAVVAVALLKPEDYVNIKSRVRSLLKTGLKIKKDITDSIEDLKAQMDLSEINDHLAKSGQLKPDNKIMDERGNEFESYDLSDFLPEIKQHEQKKKPKANKR